MQISIIAVFKLSFFALKSTTLFSSVYIACFLQWHFVNKYDDDYYILWTLQTLLELVWIVSRFEMPLRQLLYFQY